MHEHDLDLVAAYADGSLTGDTSEVVRLISSCEVCRAEFEGQRRVIELLAAARPPELDPEERRAIRDRVWARLQAELRTVPTVPAARRRVPWWLRLAPVAAGILVVVVGVGVLLQSGGGESTGVADLAAETTPTAAPAATVTTGAAELATPLEEPFGEMADGDAIPEAGMARAALVLSADLGETTLEEIERTLDQRSEALMVPEAPDDGRPIPSCTDFVEGEILDAVTGIVDGTQVEAYLVDDGAGPEIVVLALPDCVPFDG